MQLLRVEKSVINVIAMYSISIPYRLQMEKEMNRLFLEQRMEDTNEDFLDLSDYKKIMKDKEELKRNWRDEDFV